MACTWIDLCLRIGQTEIWRYGRIHGRIEGSEEAARKRRMGVFGCSRISSKHKQFNYIVTILGFRAVHYPGPEKLDGFD